MSSQNEVELREAIERFLDAFEDVFDRDWSYTRTQLGMPTQHAEDRAAAQVAAIFGEEPLPPPASERTFLDPRDSTLEIQNWGNYELLLDAYARLRTLVPRNDTTKTGR